MSQAPWASDFSFIIRLRMEGWEPASHIWIIIKYAVYKKKQIKTGLLWGNIQREKLSVGCRVCKRYHLSGGWALPTDRLPLGKLWWNTPTRRIHPSIHHGLLLTQGPGDRVMVQKGAGEPTDNREKKSLASVWVLRGFLLSWLFF